MKSNNTHNGIERCKGNCPNVCKVHHGEYEFCTNEGCICHNSRRKSPPHLEDVTKRFDEKFGLVGHDFNSDPMTKYLVAARDFIFKEITTAITQERERIVGELNKIEHSSGWDHVMKIIVSIVNSSEK